MADTTKTAKTNDAKNEQKMKATVKLPRISGTTKQQEFVSVNFKNYIIQRGIRVEVPDAVAEVIENAERAEEFAIQYANSTALEK